MISKKERYQEISEKILKCKKCLLCETAIQSVIGEGSLDAKIIFIGEAPGKNEDEQGRPFVGRAGKLLDSCLGSIGLERGDVWIGNLIKHRPPKNRDPLPEEIKACQDYLTQQIEIIDPLIIVTLGRFSFNYFFPNDKIGQERGKLKRLGNYHIFPVYHPAAALRNKKFLSTLQDDFLQLSRHLEEFK
ncbi:MAG: uracil-DNA glycosylase [Proteobacteria bacterium]|nr:uracil-DNA glycosylase [Pseudomonadota bacterium]